MNYLPGSLYICDLRKDINEAILYNTFSTVGPILSIHLRRDIMTRRSLGYAYINYENALHAELAMRKYNYQLLMGVPMRIMWSQRDPSVRKSGIGNVFVKNLHTSIDQYALYTMFAPYGYIISCKIVMANDGVSLGYGFVHFEYLADAHRAIRDLNRMEIKGKQIHVCPFLSRQERERRMALEDPFTNLYIKNFEARTSEREFCGWFQNFGNITSFRVMRNGDGSSRGFGFVSFSEPSSAKEAIRHLNGTEIQPGRFLYVGKALTREERRREMIMRMRKYSEIHYVQFLDEYVFVKRLPDFIDEQKLEYEFGEFGTVISVQIARENGRRVGFAIVRMCSFNAAYDAAFELNERSEIYRNKYNRTLSLTGWTMHYPFF